MDKDLTHLLTEEIDKELLSKLPQWFVIVREAYKERERTNLHGQKEISPQRHARLGRHLL